MKILLIDEHIAIQEGLRVAAKTRWDAELVWGNSATAAKERVAEGDIDLVIADCSITQEDTLGVLAAGSNRFPFPVIVYTAVENPTFIARSLALGAENYVFKASPIESLIAAVDDFRRKSPADVEVRVREIRDLLGDDYHPNGDGFSLTNREGQVLRHLGLGLSNREIGGSMSISVETVKEHVQNILRKIDANDRTDAAVKAVRSGILNGV